MKDADFTTTVVVLPDDKTTLPKEHFRMEIAV